MSFSINNKYYCYSCDELVDVVIKNTEQFITIKGEEFKFFSESAFCNTCNARVNISKFEDKIIKKANDLFREQKGIIRISEIESILEKYQIGAKPLSKLLGWGENTILRYLTGLTPNKEYSNKLKELFDPENIMAILNDNKKVITKTAFNKVIMAIKNINTNVENKPSLQIADYFVNKFEEKVTEKFMMYFCPLCNIEHEIEKRIISSEALVRGMVVEHEKTIFYCAVKEAEFTPSKLMDKSFLKARNAYRKKHDTM